MLRYDMSQKGLNYISEELEYCPICTVDVLTRFQLRGSCDESDVDTMYVLQKSGELLGFTKSRIIWSDVEKRWIIESTINRRVLAYSSEIKGFPLGVHKWIFLDDNCTDLGKEWRTLKFHLAVDQPGNFCCDDGLCIDAESKCYNRRDCSDHSDEKHCDIVNLPAFHYDKDKPPMENAGGRLTVNMTVRIMDFININEAEASFAVILKLSLTWYDNRVSFSFLKRNRKANIIHPNSEIWIPMLNMLTLKKEKRLNTEITVSKIGQPRMSSGLDSINPNETYSGEENPIVLRSIYQNSFFCNFDNIKNYPFDEQICDIKIFLPGNSQELTELVGELKMPSILSSVKEYEVKSWSLRHGDVTTEGIRGVIVSVHLGRNILSILMVTYLPTLLINIINQATNYISSDLKDDILITVNITSMMVLTSIYLSVSGSLTATATIKPVETWLLFNLAYPFMIIIVNILRQVIL